MAGTYITHDDVIRRISFETVQQVFDDLQNGDWQDTVDQFIDEAESDFEEDYAKIYGADQLTVLRAEGTSVSPGTKRIIRDMFVWRMGARHPAYTFSDWKARKELIDQDMQKLRLRVKESDDVDAPDAQCEGGTVQSGDPDDTDPVKAIFGDMGIF